MKLAAIAFIVVLAIIVGAFLLFVVRPEGAEQRKLKRRLKTVKSRTPVGVAIVKEVEALSSVAALDALLGRLTRVVEPTQRLIDQSGVHMTVGSFVFATGTAALLPALLAFLVGGSLLIGLIAGAVTGWFPLLWLRHRRRSRLWRFEEQFPEGIDLISRALKAGHTFQTGLLMVAEELPKPVGTEFRIIYDHQGFGMPLGEALRAFADRTPVLDAKFFVTAVLTQRDAGGNLAEVLDNLSSVIRERFKVKRQVRAVSAHGRITGWVLSGLPPALACVFAIVSPQHIQTLYRDPLGQQMIMFAVGLQIIGSLLVRKIVNIEY